MWDLIIMPIQVYRHAPRIYIGLWTGSVTFEEIQDAEYEMFDIITQHNDHDVVVILNGTNLKHIPFEIRKLQSFVRNQSVTVKAYLLVNPPIIGEIAGRIVHTLTDHTIESFDDLAAAEARAQELLAST